jgi:hypothetical protein
LCQKNNRATAAALVLYDLAEEREAVANARGEEVVDRMGHLVFTLIDEVAKLQVEVEDLKARGALVEIARPF